MKLKIYQSIFEASRIAEVAEEGSGLTDNQMFFICILSALLVGFLIALCYTFRNEFSKNLVIAIALLPAIVCVLIMLISGSNDVVGTGFAVGGIFALTRFRSAQGSAKDITHIFLSMAVGLTLGLGYIYVAFILAALVEAVSFIFVFTKFGEANPKKRSLKITIPEDLDYGEIFDDLFDKYTTECELIKVKLKNLGTMYNLTYTIMLKDVKLEKEFLDEIRIRNGNLDIICSRVQTTKEEL